MKDIGKGEELIYDIGVLELMEYERFELGSLLVLEMYLDLFESHLL